MRSLCLLILNGGGIFRLLQSDSFFELVASEIELAVGHWLWQVILYLSYLSHARGQLRRSAELRGFSFAAGWTLSGVSQISLLIRQRGIDLRDLRPYWSGTWFRTILLFSWDSIRGNSKIFLLSLIPYPCLTVSRCSLWLDIGRENSKRIKLKHSNSLPRLWLLIVVVTKDPCIYKGTVNVVGLNW